MVHQETVDTGLIHVLDRHVSGVQPYRAGATPDAMEQFRSAARADLNVGDLEEEDPAVFDRLGQISVPSSLMVGDADFPPLVLAAVGVLLLLAAGFRHLAARRQGGK